MSTPSKVKKLPPEKRAQVDARLDAHVPVKEIEKELRDDGFDVSKSGIHRYKQSDYDPMVQSVRYAQAFTQALRRENKEVAEGEIARGFCELLESLSIRAAAAMQRKLDSDEGIDTGDLKALASVLALAEKGKKLSYDSRESNADYEARVQRDLAEMVEQTSTVMIKGGLSESAVTRFREQALGIGKRP